MFFSYLWPIHAIIMSTAFIAIIAAVVISRFFRQNKWWFTAHQSIGKTAGILSFTGAIIAIIMISLRDGEHLQSLHAIVGAIGALMLVFTPQAGLFIRTVSRKKMMSTFHKVLGYTSALIAVLAVITGILISGIFFPAEAVAVTESEGMREVTSGDVVFRWQITDEYLVAELQAPAAGWVAVGINPEQMMEGADFIIGYVEEGETFIQDEYGNGLTSHAPDTELGGTDNIEILEGLEAEGLTLIRFRRPLHSGDEYDHFIEQGSEVPVIFAYSDEDDYTSMHTHLSSVLLTF
ncbi:MAG: DOMON domain-containing protein [Spirochaetia bacterium]